MDLKQQQQYLLNYCTLEATLTPDTRETYIVTDTKVNNLPKDKDKEIKDSIRLICASILELGSNIEIAENRSISDNEVLSICKYLFHKFAEITYKTIKDPIKANDVKIDLAEAFTHFKVDLPEKVTYRIGKKEKRLEKLIINACMKAYQLGLKESALENWFLIILTTYASLGYEVIMEMELDR